jgi:hypothetical protein
MTDFTELSDICRKINLEAEKSEYKKRFICGKSLYEWATIWFKTDNDTFFDRYGFNFNPHEYEDLYEIAQRDVYPEDTSILKNIGSDHMDRVEVTYSVNRTDFESCDDCIHSGDSVEICKNRLCYHAIDKLHDCYEPKGKKGEKK